MAFIAASESLSEQLDRAKHAIGMPQEEADVAANAKKATKTAWLIETMLCQRVPAASADGADEAFPDEADQRSDSSLPSGAEGRLLRRHEPLVQHQNDDVLNLPSNLSFFSRDPSKVPSFVLNFFMQVSFSFLPFMHCWSNF